MFTTGLKRLGMGLPVVAWLALAACNDDVSSSAADAGTAGDDASVSVPGKDGGKPVTDSGVDSGSRDSGSDAGPPMACTGAATLAIVGDYLAADGTQHWLRKTASATTYARVPSGKADNTKPPRLWKIMQVCSDQKAFVATTETSEFARIDWTQDASGIQICVAVEDARDATAALAAGKSTPGSATGCKGAAWSVLTVKGGDL